MYTERKIHSGFVGTLLLVAALVVLFFHTRPSLGELNRLQTAVAALEAEAGSEESQPGKIQRTSLTETERKLLDLAVPETLEQDQIINDINRIAKSAEVSFNAITFSLLESSALPTVNISAGFQGTPEQIARFLKMLESNSRKFVVRDAGLSRSEVAEGFQLVNLNLTIQSFYRT